MIAGLRPAVELQKYKGATQQKLNSSTSAKYRKPPKSFTTINKLKLTFCLYICASPVDIGSKAALNEDQ
jgi:hypothetical protein